MRQLTITGKNGEWQESPIVESYGINDGYLWILLCSKPFHRKVFPLSALSEITEKEVVSH